MQEQVQGVSSARAGARVGVRVQGQVGQVRGQV